MSRSLHFRFPLLFLGICLVGGCALAGTPVRMTGASGKSVPLRALCAEAKAGILEGESSTAWFSFNSGKALVPSTPTVRAGRGGLEVTLQNEGASSVRITLALVTASDLTAQGTLLATLPSRPLSVVSSVSGELRVRMLFPDSGELADVRGFAVSLAGDASSRVRIVSASVVKSETGWQKTTGSFWAGFEESGGSIDCLDPQSASVRLFPGSTVYLSFDGSDPGTPLHQNRAVFQAGGREFGFRKTPGPLHSYLSGYFVPEAPVDVMTVSGVDGLSGFRALRNAPFALATGPASKEADPGASVPILADPHMIIEWPQAAWRRADREVFAWDRFPSIIIFDTADYAVQDRLFKRLAFFVEKQGYRGKLVSDGELAGLHAYNAHDYRAESLASFFEAARASDFPLNGDELELRAILEAEGIIRKEGKSWVAGAGAVLSFSRESAGYLRYLFMAHEGYHGIYFIDPDFRAKVSEVYHSMDRRAIGFLETYFTVVDSLGYDTGDSYLMENEFMAYLMQQPEDRVATYFTENIAERYRRYGGTGEYVDYIEATDASEFVRAAQELQGYVFGRWGLTGGRIGLYFFD